MRDRRDRSRKGHEREVVGTLESTQKLDEKLESLEDLDEVMDEDLREFMAADSLPCKADPGFRERLREKLWDLVERKAWGASSSDEAGSEPKDEEPTGD